MDKWFADTGLEVMVKSPKFSYVKDGVVYTYDEGLDVWAGDRGVYKTPMDIPDTVDHSWMTRYLEIASRR